MTTLTAGQKQILVETWNEALRIAPDLSVSAWAEANIELTADVTNFPGKLDLDRSPYLREIADAYDLADVEEIVWVAATQVAKTILQLVCICYTIAHAPAPSLFVMPSEKTAKKFSKGRLLPVVRSVPEIRNQVDDWSEITTLEMKFRHCSFSLVGSNSPAGLASTPIGRLFLDEVDKFAGVSAKEASAFNLAKNRTRTFPRKKHLVTSTPTLESGDIWQEFLEGDQRYFHLPCVHCGVFDRLDFRNVRWPSKCRRADGAWNLDAVRATAVYVCPHCGDSIDDDAKKAMLLKGEWRPTAEGAPGKRSYHLNGLYPIWAEWGALAVEWLQKKKNPDDFRDFLNSVLAQPWREVVQAAESDDVLKLRDAACPPGYCPFEPLEVIIAADKQLRGYWYTVRAWGEGERNMLLEDGFVETDEDLLDVAATEYRGPSGPIHVTCRAMDSGDFTEEVYTFCREHGWQPVKGDAKEPQTFPAKFSPNDRCGRLLIVKTDFCKDAIERKLQVTPGRPGAWGLHAAVDQRYADHLTSEKKVEERDKLGKVQTKRKVTGPNHLLDTEVYGYACAQMKRVRFRKLRSPADVDVDDRQGGGRFVRKPKHFKEGLRS